MIGIFKNLFAKSKEKEYVPDPPGRTFKKILTGRYFGCEDRTADEARIAEAKQSKIAQIKEHELIPMFLRYTYEKTKEETQETKIHSVHVTFQKEVLAQKWNMVHVTEISFTINSSDIEEFEKMSSVTLSEDFRDLTPNGDTLVYQGEERRKKNREQ